MHNFRLQRVKLLLKSLLTGNTLWITALPAILFAFLLHAVLPPVIETKNAFRSEVWKILRDSHAQKKIVQAKLKQLPKHGNGKIVDFNGNLVSEEYDTYASYLPYDALPQFFIWALVAAEDKNFFVHEGIDYLSILSVVVDWVIYEKPYAAHLP